MRNHGDEEDSALGFEAEDSSQERTAKTGWFATTKGFSRQVKLTSFRGTSLKPVPPSGEHEQGRSLDLREGDVLDERLPADWIRQAAALPGWGSS